MHEIKFRGKKIDNGEWVYGYYVVLIEGIRKNHCIVCRNSEDQNIKYYVDAKTVCQFTGEKDTKNGKEIYKGDLIKIEHFDDMDWIDDDELGEYNVFSKNAQICEIKDRGIIEGEFQDFGIWLIDWAIESGYEVEIIGNIYENPELLEV